MLAERLQAEIVKLIASGELPAGAKLPTEAALCRMFGVSRPTVREALSRLRSDGMIETRRGSGSIIRFVEPTRRSAFEPVASIADLIRFFDFRLCLESEMAAQAAVRCTPAEIARMEEALDLIHESGDGKAFDYEADFTFHLLVVDAGRNKFFSSAMRLVEDQTKFGMGLSDYFASRKSRTRIDQIATEHRAILDAIRAGDPVRARAAVSNHLMASQQRILGDKSATSEPELASRWIASDLGRQNGRAEA